MKKVVLISDLHCGHRAGLTPPSKQYRIGTGDTERDNFALLQSGIWDFMIGEIKELGKVDVLICNGDAIDGKGERSGGTELLEADRTKQADMAAECLSMFKAKKIFMTYGTPYHVGK
jgi:hypothetical protein